MITAAPIPERSRPQRRSGTVGAALAYPSFRRVFAGQFASNIGTWMQNVTLIALANTMTGSPTFVGLVTFAQLGPVLFLSPFGGVVADRFSRRHTMMWGSAIQGILSGLLAVLAFGGWLTPVLLVGVVAAIGIAGALAGPSAQALLPALVDPPDLAGAVALGSFNMNASRVLGPLLAAATAALHNAGWSFGINAVTYLFVIAALAPLSYIDEVPATHGERPLERLAGGYREARRVPIIGRVLVLISVFSLCSLVFIYQLPGIAEHSLHITGSHFYWLFAAFGAGAALGALFMGTVFGGRPLEPGVPVGFVAFAICLTLFALNRQPTLSFLLIALLGFAYFSLVTSLLTILQQTVENTHRGRVMALWMVGWAGLVPVGSLLAGPLIEATSATTVLLGGAAVALALAPFARLDRIPGPASR